MGGFKDLGLMFWDIEIMYGIYRHVWVGLGFRKVWGDVYRDLWVGLEFREVFGFRV